MDKENEPKLENMSIDQLVQGVAWQVWQNGRASAFMEYVNEMKRRICAVKSVYRIRYKFLPNDRDLLDCPEVFVRSTGYKEACQVLLDANFNWLDHDMAFLVGKVGGCYMEQFTSSDLE